MKALKSTVTGNVTGWNRNVWKTGLMELIDSGDKPTPPAILEDICAVTGMNVEDPPAFEDAVATQPVPPAVQPLAEDDPAVTETEEGGTVDLDAELDLDDIDVDNL